MRSLKEQSDIDQIIERLDKRKAGSNRGKTYKKRVKKEEDTVDMPTNEERLAHLDYILNGKRIS